MRVRGVRRPGEGWADAQGRSVPYIAAWTREEPQALERDAREIDRLVARLEREGGLRELRLAGECP